MQSIYTDQEIKDFFSAAIAPRNNKNVIEKFLQLNQTKNDPEYKNANFVKTLLDKILEEKNEEMKKIPFDHTPTRD